MSIEETTQIAVLAVRGNLGSSVRTARDRDIAAGVLYPATGACQVLQTLLQRLHLIVRKRLRDLGRRHRIMGHEPGSVPLRDIPAAEGPGVTAGQTAHASRRMVCGQRRAEIRAARGDRPLRRREELVALSDRRDRAVL